MIIEASVTMGDYSYASTGTSIFSGTIGRFVSIGQYSRIGGPQHPVDQLSTSPWIYGTSSIFGPIECPDEFASPPLIGSDVWIGAGATVLQGVRIGHGAVIGAGAVVTRDVAPYGVVVGVPAQQIRTRFDDETVGRLLGLAWWEWDAEQLMELRAAVGAGADFVRHLPLLSRRPGGAT